MMVQEFERTTFTHMKWPDHLKMCEIIAKEIMSDNYNADAIIAIARGGCVTGITLAHFLGIQEFHTFQLSSYISRRQKHKFPTLHPASKWPDIDESKKYLLVDEICDTGATLTFINEEFIIPNIDIIPNVNLRTVCLTAKVDSVDKMDFEHKPYYIGQMIVNDVWLVFPWEPSPLPKLL